jgi:glycerol kinase|tara:strand:- start:2695 stop:4344 length:1650 start_codon:yes stop_codon:yes gene_type:complete
MGGGGGGGDNDDDNDDSNVQHTTNGRRVVAIDQGTTSTRCIAYRMSDDCCDVIPVKSAQLTHEQIHPKPGWVEHDPEEILERVANCYEDVAGETEQSLTTVGITNQRETIVAWDSETQKPLHNAIVWCDVRTAEIVSRFSEKEKQLVLEKTGMPISTYFSATKMRWLLENSKDVQQAAERGTLLFGTIDSWIVYKLGAPRRDGKCIHITDVTNASRYLLMNIKTLEWDDEMLDLFGIKKEWLPRIVSSAERVTGIEPSGVQKLHVTGILGDQHASSLGHRLREGDSKNTYGTGCFAMRNTGKTITRSKRGILTTVCWKLGEKEEAEYALEGAVAVGGECIRWLRDEMELVKDADEVEKCAKTVKNNGGVTFVPAFGGLFAPHWRDDSRGVIVGLTRYVKKAHICRAALEAIAYQSAEVLEAMDLDCEENIISRKRKESSERDGNGKFLSVDGGASVNDTLMQIQADILNKGIRRPANIETTAYGAALAAAVGRNWLSVDDILGDRKLNVEDESKLFESKCTKEEQAKGRSQWDDALVRTYGLDKYCDEK